jgi:hypothetical protein
VHEALSRWWGSSISFWSNTPAGGRTWEKEEKLILFSIFLFLFQIYQWLFTCPICFPVRMTTSSASCIIVFDTTSSINQFLLINF